MKNKKQFSEHELREILKSNLRISNLRISNTDLESISSVIDALPYNDLMGFIISLKTIYKGIENG